MPPPLGASDIASNFIEFDELSRVRVLNSDKFDESVRLREDAQEFTDSTHLWKSFAFSSTVLLGRDCAVQQASQRIYRFI